MILLIMAIGILIFAFAYLYESWLFKGKRINTFGANVVDESEDEIYDNTGGVKVRFYKVYEYFDGEENCIVKSERPMRKIDNDTGRKCTIYVDAKNRKAMEKRDIIRYRIYAGVLIFIALSIIAGVVYVANFVPGAVIW